MIKAFLVLQPHPTLQIWLRNSCARIGDVKNPFVMGLIDDWQKEENYTAHIPICI